MSGNFWLSEAVAAWRRGQVIGKQPRYNLGQDGALFQSWGKEWICGKVVLKSLRWTRAGILAGLSRVYSGRGCLTFSRSKSILKIDKNDKYFF